MFCDQKRRQILDKIGRLYSLLSFSKIIRLSPTPPTYPIHTESLSRSQRSMRADRTKKHIKRCKRVSFNKGRQYSTSTSTQTVCTVKGVSIFTGCFMATVFKAVGHTWPVMVWDHGHGVSMRQLLLWNTGAQ